ncbi:hypothetical protein NE237_012917 [Protea cynaroides]|uniref:Uncharacterized protein n=1 Tax=Protea cynaroides TaxID=273540 RepID=A0A9Q0JXC9_9MAGN|nr:hypothetical protein NE237_012917 [Protea cynaroides]
MATRAVKREDGVLKLVYLGWFVELHWKPVTAQEVMKKNPGYSVTHPDFLRYPWIVIQPDSVLKLGRVFYIIPNHVIRDLIKAYRLQNQLCSMIYSSQCPRQSPPVDSRAELTSMEQLAHRLVKQQSPTMSSNEMNLEQQTSYRHVLQKIFSRSRNKMTKAGQDHETNDPSVKQFSPESRAWVESWLEMTTKQQHCYQEFEGEFLDDSCFEVRPIHTSKYAYHNGYRGEIPTKADRVEFEVRSQIHERKSHLRTQSDNGRKSNDQAYEMKSCLRTQSDNGRKSHGHRVTFVLPGKEQKERRF